MSRHAGGFSKSTFLVTTGSFCADLATEMLTPILPIFLTRVLNANGSIVGLVDGIAQAVRNIIDGFSGWISDKLQQRKAIVLAGYAMSAMAKPIMGVSTMWEGVIAARILDRLGAGVRSAPRDAIVASSVNKLHRGGGFGLEGLGQHAGAFMGPLVTMLLLYALQSDMRVIFYLALVPALLGFVVMLLVRERPPATRPSPSQKVVVHPRNFPNLYWKYLGAVAIFSVGNSSNAFLILRTEEVSASLLATTLIYAGFNFVAAVVSYPLASLSDNWGRKAILLASCGVFLTVYVGFSFVEGFAGLISLFLLYGVYQGSFRSVGRAFATDLAPETLRASAIGWFSTVVGLCQLIASLAAGVLWDYAGHASPFILGTASATAGIVAIAVLLPWKSQPGSVEAMGTSQLKSHR